MRKEYEVIIPDNDQIDMISKDVLITKGYG